MRTATKRFRSKEGYRKWLAYGHIHNKFAEVPGHQMIIIAGKKHKVKHGRK